MRTGTVGRIPRRIRGGTAVFALALGLLSADAGLSGAPEPGERGSEKPAAAGVRKDLHGDPIPAGALARLGTVRLRAPRSLVAVTADGKEIVTVGQDLVVRRFNARTGELRSTRSLPPGQRSLVCLSPGGAYAMTRSGRLHEKGQLEVWDLASLKCRQAMPAAEGSPRVALFAAVGTRAAVVDESSHISVWDWEAAKSRVVSESADESSKLAISADGKRLAATSRRGRVVECWDADGGKRLWQEGVVYEADALQFSPDGRKVVALVRGHGLDFRDAATGKRDGKPLLRNEFDSCWAFDLSPDGTRVVLQGLEAGVFPLDPRSGKAPLRLPLLANFPFGEPVLESSAHAFTPDGTGLICRTDVLQRWDLATGKPVFPATERWGHTDGVTRLLFSADGRFLASASRGDESAYVWELGSGRALHAIQTGGEHLALTPDGRHVLTSPKNVSGEYVPLQMWDVKTGGVTRSFSKNWWFEWLNFAGQELRVTPDGKKVFMLTDSDGTKVTGTLYAWHLENGKRISRRTVPWGPGSVLTPDCASVVACDEQGVVRVLEVNTAKPRLAFRLDHPHGGDEQPTDCKLALSPDGRLMAARFRYPREDGEEADTGPCYLGDMASGRQIAAVDCEGPAAFTFSEDGRLFAVASGDVVRLWETASGRKAGSIQVPAQPGGNPAAGPAALAVALSPDGRTLATGHADGTILLWDATLREGARGGPLSAARVQALWADLADADAGRAYVAVWALADDAQLSVPALRDRLRPVAPAAAEKIKALIADLDNDRFDTREAAERTLREFGEGAVPALREALGRELPVECKRRLEGVVASLEPTSLPSREQLRQVRAVMVLERAGTAEARQFLERLAGGVESARLTRAAHDAVKRMAKK